MAILDISFLVQDQTTTCNYCTKLFNFFNFSKEHPYFRIRSNCKGVCLFQGVHLFWTIDYVPLAIFEYFRHRNFKHWNLLLYFWLVPELFSFKHPFGCILKTSSALIENFKNSLLNLQIYLKARKLINDICLKGVKS